MPSKPILPPSAPTHRVNASKETDPGKSKVIEQTQPGAKKRKPLKKTDEPSKSAKTDKYAPAESSKSTRDRADDILNRLVATSELRNLPPARVTPLTNEEMAEAKKRLYRTKDDL